MYSIIAAVHCNFPDSLNIASLDFFRLYAVQWEQTFDFESFGVLFIVITALLGKSSQVRILLYFFTPIVSCAHGE